MSDTYKDHGHPPGWENDHDPNCQECAKSELASSAGSVRMSLAWPSGEFRINDMPGEHEPCYLICPDGWMIPFNAHATNGIDQARAQWFADTLNAALNDKAQATPTRSAANTQDSDSK